MFPGIKKRMFWGGKLWTQNYFVESIGNTDEKAIRKYVQNQLLELDNSSAVEVFYRKN